MFKRFSVKVLANLSDWFDNGSELITSSHLWPQATLLLQTKVPKCTVVHENKMDLRLCSQVWEIVFVYRSLMDMMTECKWNPGQGTRTQHLVKTR